MSLTCSPSSRLTMRLHKDVFRGDVTGAGKTTNPCLVDQVIALRKADTDYFGGSNRTRWVTSGHIYI
jgi:hypothetical protein